MKKLSKGSSVSKLNNIFFVGDPVELIRAQCSCSDRRCIKCATDRMINRGTVSKIVPKDNSVFYEVKFLDPDATYLYEPHRLRLVGGDSNTNIRRATTFVYFTDFLTDNGLLQEIIK